MSKKQGSKTLIFELPRVTNCISRLCTNPLGDPPPPPPDLIPKQGEKHVNTAYNMLYIAWMVILGDDNIKKTSFKNFHFSAVRGEKLHKQVCTNPLGGPPPPPPDLLPK